MTLLYPHMYLSLSFLNIDLIQLVIHMYSTQVSLNKFLRLAGDLLPPPLFVPYLEMLSGLANSPEAAHHCFNLLKSTANGPVSWDHFFGSIKQYYMDLRQDGGNTGNLFTVLFLFGWFQRSRFELVVKSLKIRSKAFDFTGFHICFPLFNLTSEGNH